MDHLVKITNTFICFDKNCFKLAYEYDLCSISDKTKVFHLYSFCFC